MHRLTWILFALFSLVLPILSAPVAAPEGMALEKRATHSGRGTWYTPGLGSCGGTNNGGQLVVALSENIMKGSYCGKTVSITCNGKTSTAKIVDTCPGCGSNDLDMSPSLFKHFASLDQGVIQMKWYME